MWLVLEPIQDRRLEKVFHDELVRRLDIRAVETRHRFEQFLHEWQLSAHGLSNHWRIEQYLSSSAWRERTSAGSLKRYTGDLPPWLERGHPMLSSIEPNQIVLLDNRATPREIYEKQPLPFGLERLFEYYSGRNETMVTLIDQVPYLLVWSNIAYQQEDLAAVLLLIVPVDERFLSESQNMAHGTDTLIALIDANTLKLLASSDREKVSMDSYLNDWHEHYLLTSQAITRFQSMEQNLLFTTLVSRDAVQKTISNITKLAQQDRLMAASV